MTDAQKVRLCKHLAAWVREEAELGYSVFLSSTANVCWTHGEQTRVLSHEEVHVSADTAEKAARRLAEKLTPVDMLSDRSPDRKSLVWRIPPEIEFRDGFDSSWEGYARLCYVPRGTKLRPKCATAYARSLRHKSS